MLRIDEGVLLVPGSDTLGHEDSICATHVDGTLPKLSSMSNVSHFAIWLQMAVARSVHCGGRGALAPELPSELPPDPPLPPPSLPFPPVMPPVPELFELLLEQAEVIAALIATTRISVGIALMAPPWCSVCAEWTGPRATDIRGHVGQHGPCGSNYRARAPR